MPPKRHAAEATKAATDTIDYVDTDSAGLTSTRTAHVANYPPDQLAKTAASRRQKKWWPRNQQSLKAARSEELAQLRRREQHLSRLHLMCRVFFWEFVHIEW
jgi:hypothetical protein